MMAFINTVAAAKQNVLNHLAKAKSNEEVNYYLDFLKLIEMNYPEKHDGELINNIINQGEASGQTKSDSAMVAMQVLRYFKAISEEIDPAELIKKVSPEI